MVKKSYRCTRVADIIQTVRSAFVIANEGVCGPVFIEIPVDVLYPIQELQTAMGFLERRQKTHVKKSEIHLLDRTKEDEIGCDTSQQYLDKLPLNSIVYLNKSTLNLPIS